MSRLAILLILLAHSLLAEVEQDYSLVNLTKSPIQRVAGAVNIITGNWVDQSTHHATTGPDPYVIGHSYISSSIEEGSLADGWDLYHPSTLEVYQPLGIHYVRKAVDISVLPFGGATVLEPECFPIAKGCHSHHKPPKPQKPRRTPRDSKADRVPMIHPHDDNQSTLVYRDAGGASYVFTGDNYARHMRPKIHKSGYNHISSIEHQTRRDIRRTKVEWDKDHDEWVVSLGDGTTRLYSRTNAFKHRPYNAEKDFVKTTYHIREEILPSGNRRWFHYDSDNELKCIQTVSSDKKHVLHFVEFHRKDHCVDVKTSEGITTSFSLKKLHDRKSAHVVDAISRPTKGTLSFTYCEKSSRHQRRIYEKSLGNGRKDVVKFYHQGKNDAGDEKVKISSKKEKKFLEHRVREIWTKQLAGASSALSHSFTYKDWDTHCKARVEESDGATIQYMWDKELRPTWIAHEDSKGHRLNSEHFIWGEGSDEGRLLRRTHLDNGSQPILDHEFEFDDDGNVVKETLRGQFSGTCEKRLTIDDDKHVHGGETLTWKARYTDDGRALKKAEVDPLGNWTYYEYDDKRCLLTARFTCHKDHIIKREFFTYDAAAICIKSVIDDGSSRHVNKRSNVTRQMIHSAKPRYVTPYFGAPEEETWSCWTPEGGEQVLKTERYTRDAFGRTIVKELLDSAGVVQKRWTYAYDSYHRVIESCDPIGRIEQFSYDIAGRIASRITPEATITYIYDLLDRVIEEKKTFPDGTTESMCSEYDLTGRVVTTIDSRGRRTKKVKDGCGRLVKAILPALATENGTVSPETSVMYDGLTERSISPTGGVTCMTRSATGKPLVTVNPFGAVTYYAYDKRDRLIQQQDPSGLRTVYEYDDFDRPTRVEQFIGDTSVSLVTKKYRGFDLIEENHPTKRIKYFYDTLGRKNAEEVTDLITNQVSTTSFYYDSLDRIIRTVNNDDGSEERVVYDSADRVIEKRVLGLDGSLLSITTTAYDLAGRVIEEGVGRAGTIARTTTTYGAFGLLERVTYPDGTSMHCAYNPLFRWSDGHLYFQKVTVDARGVTTEQLLDSNDEARVTLVKDPFANLISNTTKAFSVVGKPVLIEEHIIASGHESSVVRTRLDYDVAGQMISCTLAEGTSESATWQYQYDVEGRKVGEMKPSGISLSSAYDAKGRLISFSSSDGTVAWDYHYNVQDLPETIENRVSGESTRRQYNGLGMLTLETLETGLSLAYDYTSSGLLSSITYPDGSRSSYQYSCGRLDRIERNGYAYQVTSRDTSGLITEAALPGAAGPLLQELDLMGRRTLVSNNAFQERRTSFDPVGNCLERMIDGVQEVFAYDYLSQITNDNGRSASYDSLHQRLETEGKQAIHNARHQILSQGDDAFHYDIDGRRMHDNRYRYFYDACDRLIAIEDSSTRYEYAYDPLNRRLFSITYANEGDGWVQRSFEGYLWQDDCEIGSVDKKGSIQELRILGEGLGAEIGATVAMELSGELFVPIHDLSGHIRAIVNRNGEVVEKLSYTAFGLQSRTSDITPWTFSSKLQDRETGFLYFGRRCYDPATATWLTQDPLGISAGPNLYAYVKNNPLTLFDLFGLEDQVSEDRNFLESAWDAVCNFFSGDQNSDAVSGPSQETDQSGSGRDVCAGIMHGGGRMAEECAKDTMSFFAAVAYIVLADHSEQSVEDLIAVLERREQFCEKLDSLTEETMQAIFPVNRDSRAYQNTRLWVDRGGTAISLLRSFSHLANGGLCALSKKGASFEQKIAKEVQRFGVKPAGSSVERHIFNGHTGGINPKKTQFPNHWSEEQIMKHVNDLPNDKNIPWKLGHPGPDGTTRYLAEGMRDGVMIRVVIDEKIGIVSAYPLQ